MATIRPFRGLRYQESAGELANLVAPPYDVINADEREVFAGRSDNNVVRLTLPEQESDDRSQFVKYMRSASRLAEWRRSGIMAEEGEPAFYRYIQTFTAPGYSQPITRTSLIALIKVEPYENGVVLPHEQTFPKHKQDRLRILEATRAHLECIYGLFEDEGGAVFAQIESAPGQRVSDVTTDDGVRHILETITDAATLANLEAAVSDKRVWIADGHHRYETALNFRQMTDKPGVIAEDFMMMALSSIGDPGLIVLPTHRIVPKMPCLGTQLEDKLREKFNVRSMLNRELLPEMERLAGEDTRVFGIATKSGAGFLISLDRPDDALTWVEGDESRRLKLLDANLLHRVIFEQCLGLKGLDFFWYTRDPEEALEAVNSGKDDAAFLMTAPTVDDMRFIALGGEKMPQKSTYYYPKILSGLVLWALEDF